MTHFLSEVDILIENDQTPLINLSEEHLLSGLGACYVLNYQAKALHWNVTGESFHQYHVLCDESAEAAMLHVDEYAEYLRSRGVYMPRGLGYLVEKSFISGTMTARSTSPTVLIGELAHQQGRLAVFWMEVASSGDTILQDIATRMAAANNKAAWKLNSTAERGGM